jgi:predicted acylesterase/phospholipase RssA
MKYLVLGPGGMGMFSMVGNLKSIEERLDSVQEISGSSAGSLVGAMIAMGMTPSEIIERMTAIEGQVLMDGIKLMNLFKKFGFIDVELMRDMLHTCLGGNPKLGETKKVLHVAGFCVEKAQTVYFNSKTHPDMHVIDALMISVAVPLIFTCPVIDGYHYMDGGTEEALPLTPFLGKPSNEIWVFEIKVGAEEVPQCTSFMDYARCIMRILTKQRYRHDCPVGRVITTNIQSEQVFKFNMTLEEKMELYLKGFFLT